MAWHRPDTEEIRAALRLYAPQLAETPISFFSEGWEFWAFTAGEYVLRFPMRDRGSVWKLGNRSSRESLEIQRALTPELVGTMPCEVAVIDLYGDSGPNNAPFAGHRFLPGEVLMSASRSPSSGFGHAVGLLLRALRAFPERSAVSLGVPVYDGPRLRDDRLHHYEDVIRRAFPLLGCEARTHVERTYEAYLNDAASFDFEPVLAHTDLAVNLLIRPDDGSLCGVIDFGDATVSSPALDFWLPVYGFEQLGIPDQRAACLAAAGIGDSALRRFALELAFLHVRNPLLGILHGLNIGEAQFVAESIRELNAIVPSGIECE